MATAKKKLMRALAKTILAADKNPNATMAISGAAGLGAGYGIGWKNKSRKEKASELKKYGGE